MLINPFNGRKVSATGTLIWYTVHACILLALMLYYPVSIPFIMITSLIVLSVYMYRDKENLAGSKTAFWYVMATCAVLTFLPYFPMLLPFVFAGAIIVQSIYLYLAGGLD